MSIKISNMAEIKKGTRVRITGKTNNHQFNIGEEGWVIDNVRADQKEAAIEGIRNSYWVPREDMEILPPKRKFKVGDTVKLHNRSGFYGISEDHPANVHGTITAVGSSNINVNVKWSTKKESLMTYPIKHLVLLKPAK